MAEVIRMFVGGIPNSIKITAEVVLILIGALECFAGFKTMKIMIAVWGFFFGAVVGTIIGIICKSVPTAD